MIMHKNADKVCPMDSVAQWIPVLVPEVILVKTSFSA